MKIRYHAVLQVVLLVVLFPNLVWSQTGKAPTVKQSPVDTPNRILFVGNSLLYYNDNLQAHVRRIAVAADPAMGKALQFKSATISGFPLSHHNIQHLLQPGGLGVKQPFDVVVLQENPSAPMFEAQRARFRSTVVEFNAEIMKRGARTALYMTHANVKPNRLAGPDMIRKVEEMYVSVANELGIFVIPVGLAFEEAYRQRPDIKLHKDYDGLHPDLLGTYLAACVVYASLYGKSPVGNSYDYYGKVEKEETAFLQKIADETVRKFFRRDQQ